VDLSEPINVPDTPLVDHRGRKVRFYSDIVRGRAVAINFIFTTCQGVCPPMGTTFAKVETALKGRGIRLISLSVDPVNDTPERLAAWAKKYGAGPDWTLLTGRKLDVDGLLRALGAFSADKTRHSPFVLLGDDRQGTWRRIHGLSAPMTIVDAITALAGPAPEPESESDSPARRYFTDVPLIDQDGRERRLYSDLIRGKVVVLHCFFASCKNTCPMMLATYKRLQDHLGDRLGRDVHLVSFTVDPVNDDVATLGGQARKVEARPGWYFLTGTRESLGLALRKLGLAAERREEHSNVFLIGNDRTQLWKMVRGLAPADDIIATLDEVIADAGEPSGPSRAPATHGED
jgi:cytochrome oxidase Cu insertion factor (SCO1/SenC/PrrC family)